MAEVLAADGWVKSGSIGAYLRDMLPEHYPVVTAARICGRPVEAVVVGRTALFVVETEDNMGAMGNGRGDAAANARLAASAVETFLADEFPRLRPPVRVLYAFQDGSPEASAWRVQYPYDLADLPLGDALIEADAGAQMFPDEAVRMELATGLAERQLTASQPASKPFVFRTGKALRVGAKARTLREVVAHMDASPADGIHHLRDGSLAAWLEEEGAHHLAREAREVLAQPRQDMRVALEAFLLASGMVARPQLAVRPPVIDLGYVIQGNTVHRAVRIDKPRGRGYLFGAAKAGVSWLRVEPRDFQGTPAEFVVTAETEGLPIGGEACTSELFVESSASEGPTAIPVIVRVSALPGSFVRRATRPLLGLLAGAMLGGGFGLVWQASDVGGSRVAVGVWPVLLGLLWGVAGLVRGIQQPPAWPALYALGRWLARIAGWAVGLGVVGALIALAWQLGLGGGLDIPGLTLPAAAAVGAGWGFLPATLDELANGRHAKSQAYVHGRRSRRRSAVLGGAAVALILVALLAPRVAGPMIREIEQGTAFQPAREWVVDRWYGLNERANRLVDEFTLRYYNKPAATETGEKTGGLKLPKLLGGE